MYVLITGASSGIGKELAMIYGTNGFDLILVARRKKKLLDLKNELDERNTNILIYDYDLSDLNNCDLLINSIKNLDVGIFINNAGFGQVGFFDEIDLNKELEMIDLNIKSLHYLSKKYVNNFDKGILVNISSLAAFLPTVLMASYAATKSYVYSFSQAINYEMKTKGKDIKVLTVAPGPVKTEFGKVANVNPSMKGMPAKKCAKIIYRGIEKQKNIIIPGFGLKVARFFLRFIPLGLALRISYKIQKRK